MIDILIADSDASQRHLIDILLSHDDYHLIMHDDGRGVLSCLRDSTPDVVILSETLPYIGGFDICSKIKRIKRLTHIPVIILLEATKDKRHKQKMQDMSKFVKADLLITKPISHNGFAERVRALIQQQGNEGILSGRKQASSTSPLATETPEVSEERPLGNTLILEEALETIEQVDISTQAMRNALEALQVENRFLRQQSRDFRALDNRRIDAAAEIAKLKLRIEALERDKRQLQKQLDKQQPQAAKNDQPASV